MTQAKLTRIRVAGFRSLRDVTLDLTPVTVLIGPNGAGKSNLLWALEMTRMLAFEALQLFVSERGGATYLMHYGPKQTPAIDLSLEFVTDTGENAYEARLGYGADESLIFLFERAGFRKTSDRPWNWCSFGAGHRESRLREEGNVTAKTVRWLLRQLNFYHFHDTSRRSALRTRAYSDTADSYLRSDGSNLPAYLLGLRDGNDPQASRRPGSGSRGSCIASPRSFESCPRRPTRAASTSIGSTTAARRSAPPICPTALFERSR